MDNTPDINPPDDCIYWNRGAINALREYKTYAEYEAYDRGYVEGYGVAWLRLKRNTRFVTLPRDAYDRLRNAITSEFLNNPNHYDLDPNIREAIKNGVTIMPDERTYG